MRISELTWRRPVVIECDATIDAAARLLERQGVGALVVVDGDAPVGIVTDRDIVTRGIARDVPLDARIDALMSTGLIDIAPNDDVAEVFARFAEHAVRRVPIVERNRVVGMVTLDDAIVAMSADLASVAQVLSTQIMYPHAADGAPAPVVTS